MFKLLRLLLLTLIISTGLMAFSQEKTDKEIFDIALFSKVIKERSSFPDYNAAEDMAKQARLQLLSGNIRTADSLIKRSIELYPTLEIFEYALSLGSLPDIVGANLIMDKAIDRVKNFPGNKLKAREPLGSRYENEKLVAVVKEFDKERALYNYIKDAYVINTLLGERKWIGYSVRRASDPVIIPLRDKKIYDFEIYDQLNMLVNKARFQKDFARAREIIDRKKVNEFYTAEYKKIELIINKIDIITADGITEENYKLLLEYIEDIPIEYIRTIGIFSIYAELGKISEAEVSYGKIEEKYRELPILYEAMAELDLHKKDYSSALTHLAKASAIPTDRSLMDAYNMPDKWAIYKLYGDIYKGLNDYGKAKDNYNISLLYYPEYKPAIDGLAKLEVKYATETATDKTPPIISLLEPSPKRGLKISSASAKVMVKGIATDPSGIKEVFINGQKVYSQNGGDFWSDVALLEGLNKITIAAVDMAGNKAEQVFEIEKTQPAVNAVQTDIIAVTEKEGKNYCLLIASQNYVDTSIPSLENPIADAVKLKIVLKQNYNFVDNNIISLFNPSGNDIKRQLLELTNTIQPEDNLLIFYAGHGIWVEKEKKGYWLMTDAVYKDMSTWTPNKDILDLIAKLPARHTLLITDACFSGSVFKTRGIPGNAPAAMKELDIKISRVAITSGNDTEVPDESVFMKHLVKALSQNKEAYLTAQKMFITQILEAVMTETKTEPRYGTLELAGHVGGDYIFSKK